MKKIASLLFLFLYVTGARTQSIFPDSSLHFPLAHTYSIVARDSATGEMGVAVQSHWFSVGSVVAWAEAGVGAVATQSFVNISFGIRGLELLKAGKTPQEAINLLLASDSSSRVRQLAIIDVKGRAAAFTGSHCIPEAGHITGNNFSVQANLMLNDGVPAAMAKAFQQAQGPLAERMLAALEAAQNAGGDIRGQQSASLLVVRGVATGKIWENRLIDLRVEDHPSPVQELKRLLKVYRAYEHMNKGDLATEKGDMELAAKEYALAEQLFAGNVEMQFWHAVMLANNQKIKEALPLFKEVFAKDSNWLILVRRLPKVGLLNVDETTLQQILSVK